MILYIDHNGDFHTAPKTGYFFNRENGVAVVDIALITPPTSVHARLDLVTHKAKLALAAAEWAERAHAPDDVVWGWAGRERWLKEAIVALGAYGRTFPRQFFFERLVAAKAMATGDAVVTTDGPDRRNRLCRCRKCGVTARCTPSNDFWTLPKDPPGSGLLCEGCFNASLRRDARNAFCGAVGRGEQS